LAAELGADCPAGAVDERVVVVQDGGDIRSGQKRAEFKRELVGVGTGGSSCAAWAWRVVQSVKRSCV
jgi:hypothetical protein